MHVILENLSPTGFHTSISRGFCLMLILAY